MGCLAVLRKPWKWRRRTPVVFAMGAEATMHSVKHPGLRPLTHRYELQRDLPKYTLRKSTFPPPPVVMCSSPPATIPEDLACTNVIRPNVLSVNAINQNRKKYVNSLHYSQISGLTPTSPFDINDSK